jgi:primosomal protein N' (replication factor Y)
LSGLSREDRPAPHALVEVALPLPVFQTFTYRVHGGAPADGTRVRVPFGRDERIGWVVGPGSGARERGLKEVLDVLEEVPSVPPDLLRLCRWMADYYVAPLGIALRAALPSVLTDASRDYLALGGDVPPAVQLTQRERRLVDALGGRSAPARLATLRRQLAMGSVWPEVRSLGRRGLLTHHAVPPREPTVKTRKVVRLARWLPDLAERERALGRAHRQREAYEVLEASGGKLPLAQLLEAQGFSRSVVAGLETRGLVELTDEEVVRDPFAAHAAPPPPTLVPTPAQSSAVEALAAALDDSGRRPFLLHGVTGSGKTLVYIELLRRVLERGRSAIVLVPEISLTPQTVTRFRAHFGDHVAVLHSALSDGERYDAWRALRSGEKRIAVGARSALFAPVDRLGAIVVDEEHDGSYKQSEAPRYHGRDLAVVRAELAGAVCVLGSATPSLESWANQGRGKFVRLSLPDRVGGGRLPPVRVVDLREVRKRPRPRPRGGATAGAAAAEGGPVLSEELVGAVRRRLEESEQVILLLNRRGYSNFIQCRECGDVRACIHCSISLTYHRLRHRLVCHHCRHEEEAPERCPSCGSRDLAFRGLGTEQVERVVAATFPGARIARMDVDTTSGKWSHHEILGRVERGEVDILLGTQMIAKGLDFPRVTLVGVVNADVGMHLPDFRACERTFQLLSQVAGRAGRGSLGGEVIVQTSLTEHYAIQAALRHDYEAFARRELDERIRPRYPPHVRLANVVLSSPDAEAAAEGAEAGARWTRRWIGQNRSAVEVVGPAPAPIERLHGRWRWHFLLRTPSPTELGDAARALVEGFSPSGADVRLVLDRDPVALL